MGERMKSIDLYLQQRDQRFYCKDNTETRELIVDLQNIVGEPATLDELRLLDRIARRESKHLAELYRTYNGLQLQINKKTIGLIITSIRNLKQLNKDWKDWFRHSPRRELYDYQREGFAFGEICHSGNYFVMYGGYVYYSSHDSADDEQWGYGLDVFFDRALSDPTRFLWEVGCYTRYSDGKTDVQYIPNKFLFKQ